MKMNNIGMDITSIVFGAHLTKMLHIMQSVLKKDSEQPVYNSTKKGWSKLMLIVEDG